MEIYSVSHIHLDKLYQCCVIKQNSKEVPNGIFSHNIVSLFNNVEISFVIKNVNIFEAFLLKKFSSYTTPLMNKKYAKDYIEVTGIPKKFATLVNAIVHDDKVPSTDDKFNYQFLYGPGYFIRGDMTATFTGVDLTKFFELEPTKFFLEVANSKCLDVNESDKKPELIQNYTFDEGSIARTLIKNFTNIFISFSKKFIEDSDVFSDIGVHSQFSNHDTLIKMRALTNPFVKIDFTENWKEQLADPTYINSSSDFKNIQFLENTYITFELFTNFSTFLDLYDKIPNKYFICLEDVKVLNRQKIVYIPNSFSNFEDILRERYEELNEYIESIKDNPIEKYSFSYLNAKYSYSIRCSFSEFNLIFGPLLKKSSINPESKSVINSMLKYMKSIYSYIF